MVRNSIKIVETISLKSPKYRKKDTQRMQYRHEHNSHKAPQEGEMSNKSRGEHKTVVSQLIVFPKFNPLTMKTL